MTPLTSIPRDAYSASVFRTALLSKPAEFFTHVFGGRVPSMGEKMCWVEEQVQRMNSLPCFANDLYVVVVGRQDPFYRLSIQRHDRRPCSDWSHLQQMKNQLFGPSHEAVELFPAEDRLIDTNNEYHLWVHADPSFRFPVGFPSPRCVLPSAAETPASIARFPTPTGSDHFAAAC